jgi:hypothetical protein
MEGRRSGLTARFCARSVLAGGTVLPTMDPQELAASLSDEEITGLLAELFRRRADLERAIAVLLREIDRRRAYRHQAGHHNGALRGRPVRRAGSPG